MSEYTISNLPDAANIDLAEPDAGDFRALADNATGVISGGNVVASSPASMVVTVEAAHVIISGEDYRFPQTNVTIPASHSGMPRFDLIGWNSSGVFIIPGEASTNARFPVFDSKTYCLAAAVFVGNGATAIVEEVIAPKAVRLPATFKRTYATDNAVSVQSGSTSVPNLFQRLADGTHRWRNSVLRQTAANAVEWLTNLTLKQTAAGQRVLDVLSVGGDDADVIVAIRADGDPNVRFGVDRLGRVQANNVRYGTDVPNGNVTAPRGTIYVHTNATNPSLAFWIKMTTSGNTGWSSFRVYDPAESSMPTGTIIAWLGSAVATPPSGFSHCQGAPLAINANTADLYDMVGDRFGTAPSGFFIPSPDLRGKYLIGTHAPWNLVNTGDSIGQPSMTLTVDHLPYHDHDVVDPGHTHPQAGPPWYYRPPSAHNNRHPWPTNSLNPPHLYVQESSFDRSARTGITIGGRGGNQPFTLLPPSHAVNYLVKW